MALQNKKQVTALTLGLMTIASVVSLRGLPMMAAEGLSMIFYILFATFVFLLPASMVSAELGGAFGGESGGVYTWVKAAFGPRFGFTAIWLQWIQNVVWYPTVLGYAAACLAYLFMDPKLAQSGTYTGVIILVVYWLATFIALRGSNAVNMVTKFGVVVGTLLPGLLIIILGMFWVDQGYPIAFLGGDVVGAETVTNIENAVHSRFFPHLSGLGSVAFLAGIVLLFAGVEVQAVQAADMKKPETQFPMAMLLASVVIILLFLLGSLAVAVAIPAKEISLTAGLMQAFTIMLDKMHLSFLTPILGLLMAFGAIGGVMSWVTGPSRGLLATAKEGEMPPIMARTNKAGAPTTLLYIQAVIVTILASLYLVIKDVSVAFFILSAMTATLYLVMYMLMFAAAITLRITRPDLPRAYKVPGGMAGMCLIAGLGFLGVAFAFVVGFFPPSNLPVGNPSYYVLLVASGLVLFTGMPIIIQCMKKPSWKPQVPNNSSQVSPQ
ncbi:MAG: amino acid permease [Pseudomonadota bacterium]